MRFRRLLVAVAAVSMVAAACSSDDDGDTAAGTTTSTEAARGGTLVASISSDPGQLNPAITTSGSVHAAAELMFNGLVELDDDLEPVPGLAEKWDIEENGALYRFHLADGVVWHDGTPFTSADVKFTFEEVLLKFHSRAKSSMESVLESITTPDPQTVEFRFKQPYAPLLQQLNVTEAPIVPRHIYEGTDPTENPANSKPVGTGPFVFESYTADSEIRMKANGRYFKEGLPKLDEVVLRITPVDTNEVALLEDGAVQWIFGVPGPEEARLAANPDIKFLKTAVNPGGANCIMTVSFNLDRPILKDVRVRRAFAFGLDRKQFLERVLFNQGKVAAAPISSGIPFAHATGLKIPEADKAQAEKLLDEVGWTRQGDAIRTARGVPGVRDGTPLAISFLSFPQFAAYGDLVKAQLREIGFDVTASALESPVFVEQVFTKRDFDTNVISFCNATDPEIGVRRMYVSSNIAPIPFSNSSAYRNAQVDTLFDRAQATVATAERTAIYRQIQEILVEELPYLWLVETTSTRAYRSSCSGFSSSGHFAETASCKS